jgi:uncharacterized protein
MRLDLTRTESGPLVFEGPIDLSAHPGVQESVCLDGPVEIRGTLALLGKGKYRLDATGTAKGRVTCSRCLGPGEWVSEIVVALTLEMAPTESAGSKEEDDEGRELEPDELDVAFYEGDEFEIDSAVAEQIVLAVPMKPLCREECLGLCPSCGGNRNESPCACHAESKDPRWEALRGLAPSDRS